MLFVKFVFVSHSCLVVLKVLYEILVVDDFLE